jgi:hypothetical protein
METYQKHRHHLSPGITKAARLYLVAFDQLAGQLIV